MKKAFALILAAMMLLGAVKGMADEGFDLENGRIAATEISRIDDMVKDIKQISEEIGNNTTEESQVMTSVSQLEEAAIRIQAEANRSTDESLIDQAFVEVLKIKEQLIQVKSQL